MKPIQPLYMPEVKRPFPEWWAKIFTHMGCCCSIVFIGLLIFYRTIWSLVPLGLFVISWIVSCFLFEIWKRPVVRHLENQLAMRDPDAVEKLWSDKEEKRILQWLNENCFRKGFISLIPDDPFVVICHADLQLVVENLWEEIYTEYNIDVPKLDEILKGKTLREVIDVLKEYKRIYAIKLQTLLAQEVPRSQPADFSKIRRFPVTDNNS